MISLLEMFYLQRRVKFRGTSLAGNFVHSIGGDVPIKHDNSDIAAHILLVETKKGLRPSKTTDHTVQQGGLPQGSYVIGGSPIGWNFLVWPGCKAVYYGLTKAVVGPSICKMKFHPPVPAI